MRWLTRGTRPAAVAEAVFNAVWVLLLLWPLLIVARLALNRQLPVAATLAFALLVGSVAARVVFDLRAATRERRGEPLSYRALMMRDVLAEETVRGAILLFLLVAGAGLLEAAAGVGEAAAWAAVAAWATALAYVPIAVRWRLAHSGPARTVWTRRRGVVAVILAALLYLVVSAAGGQQWLSVAVAVVAIVGAGWLWILWMDRAAAKGRHGE